MKWRDWTGYSASTVLPWSPCHRTPARKHTLINKVWKPAFICICNVCWPPVSRIRVWTAWRTGSHWISPSLHVLTVYRPEQGFSTICTRRTTGLKFNLCPKEGEFYPDSRRGSDGEDGVHAAGLAVVSVVDVAAVFMVRFLLKSWCPCYLYSKVKNWLNCGFSTIKQIWSTRGNTAVCLLLNYKMLTRHVVGTFHWRTV